jgi:hypothetical protein
MTTDLGPLDQALVDFCASLEAPLQSALKGVMKGVEGIPVTGMIGYVELILNKDDLQSISHFIKECGIQDVMQDRGIDLQTPEMNALVDLLRERMPNIAWPISVMVWIEASDLTARCQALGFAGKMVHLWPVPEGTKHLDLFIVDKGPKGHLTGLDRLAEMADVLTDILFDACRDDLIPTQSEAPLMSWWVEDARKQDTRAGGYHARSRFEAFLKWAVFTYGFEKTREAMASKNLQALGDLEYLMFSASPINPDDLRGKAVSLSDVGMKLASAVRPKRSHPTR